MAGENSKLRKEISHSTSTNEIKPDLSIGLEDFNCFMACSAATIEELLEPPESILSDQIEDDEILDDKFSDEQIVSDKFRDDIILKDKFRLEKISDDEMLDDDMLDEEILAEYDQMYPDDDEIFNESFDDLDEDF